MLSRISLAAEQRDDLAPFQLIETNPLAREGSAR
jgi:hypothetical protein